MKADMILKNGRIFTQNEKALWASEVAVSGKKIVCVGGLGACDELAGPGTQIIDLDQKTVIPGLIDGHTHPTTVAKTIWHIRMPLYLEKERLMETIKEYAEKNPKEKVPYFFGEGYYAETFGNDGPRKEDLDKIFPDRPARIQDFTDHACWYNSVAIDMLKDEDGGIHIASPAGEAEVVKDKNGEPTGWVLEGSPDVDTGIYEAINWHPPTGTEEDAVSPFLDFLKSKGIMCIMDGFTEGEEAIRTFYDMDKEGRLNMFYEATVLMEDCEQAEEAISTVREWSDKYTTEHIHINTVKFFMDGTNEMGDSASLEPFENDGSGENYGSMTASEEELTSVLLKLNDEGIDIHIHVVCDRAFRTCCNAVENAKKICGEKWGIYVTLAHCELIHPDDMKRVAELGIFIDWTAHWSGGYFGENAIEYLGRRRWETMYDFTEIIREGGTVGFSSDLFSYGEAERGDPYFGMQTSMTRVDIELPLDEKKYPGSVRPPLEARLTLNQLLKGYTYNNALRMRLSDKIGTIEEGKLANLIVLSKDIFDTDPFEIKTVSPEMIFFEGRKQEIKEVSFL